MAANSDTEVILDELGQLIRQLTRLAGGAEDTAAMSASQRIALVEIGQDGPLRLNDLADRMGVSPPTASRAVDALEALGVAARATDADDRRALSIALTRRGRAIFDERLVRAAAAFRPAAAALTADERRALLELLERMTAALRET